jgi:flagellar basal-body rod protein FlgG
MQSLYTAATGMLAQQLNIDTISNNLANVSTTGFKKQRVDFQDLLYQNVKPAGIPTSPESRTPVGIQVGEGVKPVATQRIFTQGSIRNTNNPLDLMIEGTDTFFKVVRPDGEVGYTQAGSFNRDGSGNLVNPDGYLLDPPVQIPSDASLITITPDGKIMAQLTGTGNAGQSVEVGQIEVARFVNPAGLEAMGHNVFRSGVASGDPIVGTPASAGFPTIAQGQLELSNVDVVDEMVNLIVAQRAYEINSRAVSTADDMLSIVAGMKQFP